VVEEVTAEEIDDVTAVSVGVEVMTGAVSVGVEVSKPVVEIEIFPVTPGAFIDGRGVCKLNPKGVSHHSLFSTAMCTCNLASGNAKRESGKGEWTQRTPILPQAIRRLSKLSCALSKSELVN
jgi:hypothetical protein